MAVTSGFFNSINGDRRYNAEQMSALFDGIINDGVFANVGTAFGVQSAAGSAIKIGIGRAWFNSTWIYNDADLPIVVNAAETLLDRIDAVVIEINRSEAARAGTIRMVYGTPGSSPSKPTLINEDDVHQYPLAYIYRTASSGMYIPQSAITNVVGTSECPYVTGILEVVSIDNIVAQWQSEFEEWFGGLEDIFSGDVAVNFANRILELETKFDDLAKDKSVYDSLEDSNGDTIEDSTGRVIQGRTMFALAGETGGSNQTVVVEEQSDPFKIGDTLATVRPNPGYGWLLCNGSLVKRESYPALSNYIPDTFDGRIWETRKDVSGNLTKFERTAGSKVKYINGKFIVPGSKYDTSSSDYVPVLAVFDNPMGDVEFIEITPFTNWNISRVEDIVYDYNYYAVVGGDSLAYTTDLYGTWTGRRVWSADDSGTVINAVISDPSTPRFVFGGMRTYEPFNTSSSNFTYTASVGYISANDMSGEITTTDIVVGKYIQSGQYDTRVNDLIYADGKYVAAVSLFTSNTNGSARLYYTDTLNGDSTTWNYNTIHTQTTSPISNLQEIMSIQFLNNLYICNLDSGRVLYGTDLINSLSSVTSSECFLYGYSSGIAYVNGYYIGARRTGTKLYFYYTDDLSKKETMVTILNNLNDNNSDRISNAIFTDDYLVFLATNLFSLEEDDGYLDMVYKNYKNMLLPEISSVDGVYTYIKALE